MPKTNFSKPREDHNKVKDGKVLFWINGLKSEKGIHTRELAKRTGINESTLYYRLKNPETFNLRELRKVMEVLNAPEAYKTEVL